jgi:hypothetical protein
VAARPTPHALAEIAYQLYFDVAYAENMDVHGAPNPAEERANRQWILRTYGWCYRNAKKGMILSRKADESH